jgi:hypothetical protein
MTRAEIRAEARRWRRGDALVVMGAVMLGAVLAWIMLTVSGLTHDLRAETARGDALAQQVRGLGGTPVAGPSGARGEPGPSVTGPSGAPGQPGADGSPGPSGSPGKTGASGAPGRGGAASADSTIPGPSGPPGADSTVPGPIGPAGPVGPMGPQGEPGEKGATGDRGPSGASCEDGYSWQTPSWDPDARVCRRDGAPDPSESPSPSSAAALDPRRLQYG